MDGQTPKSLPRSMSVADSILSEFCEALEKETDLKGLGEPLRNLILEKRIISETDIKTAIFSVES